MPGEDPDYDIKQALGGGVQLSNEWGREQEFRYAHGIHTLALKVTQETKKIDQQIRDIYTELKKAIQLNHDIILNSTNKRLYKQKFPQFIDDETFNIKYEIPLIAEIPDSELLQAWNNSVEGVQQYQEKIGELMKNVEEDRKSKGGISGLWKSAKNATW